MLSRLGTYWSVDDMSKSRCAVHAGTYRVVKWVYIANTVLQEAQLVDVSGSDAEEAPNHIVRCLLHLPPE